MLALYHDEHTHPLHKWRTIIASAPFLGEHYTLMLHCRILTEHPSHLCREAAQ